MDFTMPDLLRYRKTLPFLSFASPFFPAAESTGGRKETSGSP